MIVLPIGDDPMTNRLPTYEEIEFDMAEGLANAFGELQVAARALELRVLPGPQANVRPRIFVLAEGCSWPYIDDNGNTHWLLVRVPSYMGIKANPDSWVIPINSSDSVKQNITSHWVRYICQGQPVRVWRLVQALHAATKWAKARQAGRLRHAQNILASQARAAAKLTAEGTGALLKEMK